MLTDDTYDTSARCAIRAFPKIVHIITDLNGFGGTEATLLRYIVGSRIPLSFHHVIVLKSIGTGNTLGAQMVEAGISVLALEQKKGTMSLRAMLCLYRELRRIAPDVISGWLYHPSLLASALACLLRPRPVVVWNIRSSSYASLLKAPSRYVAQRLLALLSHWSAPVLVSNSRVAVETHAKAGFDVRPERWTIIHNGVDVGRYSPGQDDGRDVRRELGIPEDAVIIGCVGRFAPEKAYDVMLQALGLALRAMPPQLAARVHLVAIGDGITKENEAFLRLNVCGVPLQRMHLLGKRADVPGILRALDVYVLPSISEAFPNALVEAMATGIACLATHVGECADVLPAADLVVPPGDPAQLAAGMVRLIEMKPDERRRLGRENRERIVGRFTLKQMAAGFDALFERAASYGSAPFTAVVDER
jgi:glycosyltransferase involved in cell wall biosynthesis